MDDYFCKCAYCGCTFNGPKRAVTCPACIELVAERAAHEQTRERLEFLEATDEMRAKPIAALREQAEKASDAALEWGSQLGEVMANRDALRAALAQAVEALEKISRLYKLGIHDAPAIARSALIAARKLLEPEGRMTLFEGVKEIERIAGSVLIGGAPAAKEET